MLKRKAQNEEEGAMVQRPCRTSIAKCKIAVQKEARLQGFEEDTLTREIEAQVQLPSPASRSSETQLSEKKGKETVSQSFFPEEIYAHDPERPRDLLQLTEEADTLNPVCHWVLTFDWPKNFNQRDSGMSEILPSKRKSSSTHRSETIQHLAAQGVVYTRNSKGIREDSKILCQRYLEGACTTIKSSVFTYEEFSRLLDRVEYLNEARIQKDVTPWVVPSAETLFFRGELKIDYLGDEFDAEWIRCATMGSTKPKPDYTAGLLETAFTGEEIKKLENYARPTHPFRFTPDLCFPFLMCEVKSGERGLNEADRQNIHSASIAVNAIIMLYRDAFSSTTPERVDELYGKVLAFTISHDNDQVRLYGHFALTETTGSGGLKFYRYPIDQISLSIRDGAQRYTAFNFVLNVYEKFAPDHLERIKDAVRQLPSPPERTGLPFAASDTTLDEQSSEQDSQNPPAQDGGVFKRPRLPASVLQRQEVENLRAQVDKLEQKLEQQSKEIQEQSKEIQEQSKEIQEQSKEIQEQKVRERKQRELERKQRELRINSLQETISLLKPPGN